MPKGSKISGAYLARVAMGTLAPAILKNRLLAPAIFGHSSTAVGKN